MGKPKRHYHDMLNITKFTIVPHSKNLSEETILRVLKQYVTGSNACLQKFVKDGHFQAFAWAYAQDKKSVTARTAEARKLYAEALDTNLLPDCYVRRQVDILKGRIQAVLPGAAQRLVTAKYIQEHPEETDAQVAQGLWHEVVEESKWCIKVPNAQGVKNIRRQMAKSDTGDYYLLPIEPDFGDRFSFSHGDDHLGVVRRDGENIVFTSGYQGKKFDIIVHCPDKERYRTGRVCKPDLAIHVGEGGEEQLCFSFAIRHTAPTPLDPVCSLGVDVGEVYPFVCAVVGYKWHSQGIYPNKRILRLVDKMNDISFQIAVLSLRVRQDSAEGRVSLNGESLAKRAEELSVVRDQLSCKRTSLKKEIAHQVAHRVCELALACHAQVVLERLNWSDPKHAFYHSLLHDAIRNRCLSLGVPVVTVPARGTSARSPENGSVLVQGVRHGSPVTVSPLDAERSSWRSVDGSSGLRDSSLRKEVSRKTGRDVEGVSFGAVCAVREARGSRRGARDRVSGRVRDHDYVSPLNLGVRGEVARHGSGAFLSARLVGSRFVRLSFPKSCYIFQ